MRAVLRVNPALLIRWLASYFDNSGGHTTDDILRAFRRCLFDADDACKLNDRQADLQTWAQDHLVPQAIHIRKGVDAPDPTDTLAPAGLCPDDFTKPIKGLTF